MPIIAIDSKSLRHEHLQVSASAQWVIVHNFGKKPFAVHITATSGDDVFGDIVHTDTNTTTINFSVAFAGAATLGA